MLKVETVMKIIKTQNKVSKSDILGPIDYLRDINLVLFERAMFEDDGFKYRIKLFLSFMSRTLL